ncbi:MAG: hypothetical protein P1U74_10820 [Legionellaceae bacterium]|nr:hypothetical protein [Legionellaceae bacterium]
MTYSKSAPTTPTPPQIPSYTSPYKRIRKGDTYVSFSYSNPTANTGFTPEKNNTVSLTGGVHGDSHPITKSPGGTLYTEGDFLNYTTYSEQYGSLLNEMKSSKWRTLNDQISPKHDQKHHDTAYYKIELCKHLIQRIITNHPSNADELVDDLNEAIRVGSLFDLNAMADIYSGHRYTDYDWVAAEDVRCPKKPLTLTSIRAWRPDLTANWLSKYRGFRVNINPSTLSIHSMLAPSSTASSTPSTTPSTKMVTPKGTPTATFSRMTSTSTTPMSSPSSVPGTSKNKRKTPTSVTSVGVFTPSTSGVLNKSDCSSSDKSADENSTPTEGETKGVPDPSLLNK